MVRPKVTNSSSLAPLKDGLSPGRRALAEDLRRLFDRLGLTLRRYATRRVYNYTTISRYLSGERVPTWEFIAGLIADVGEEDGTPVTPEAEQALRRLHEGALRDTPKAHEIQQLQNRLAEADEETRRIKTMRKALVETLSSREQQLAGLRRRCQQLELELQEQQRAHGNAIQVWSEQFERLQSERDRLAEEVLHLREALTVTQAELIAAEQECSRLEEQLEHAQELPAEPAPAASLMQVLETADRTATIPELVALVSGLESSTRQAVASELVSSVTRRRSVSEVAALVAGLYQAGFPRHAQAALPALVVTRPLETAELVAELTRTGLDEPLVVLLRAAAELHAPSEIADLARQLHHAGLHEQAAVVVGAATTSRPAPEAVELIQHLEAFAVPELTDAALSSPAKHRPIGSALTLVTALREIGMDWAADTLEDALAACRPANDVADLLSALSWAGMKTDAEAVFRVTQTRSTEHLAALVSALHSGDMHDIAAAVLTGVISSRPVSDMAAVISNLYRVGARQYAADAMTAAVQAVGAATPTLLEHLDPKVVDSDTLLDLAACTASPLEAASMVAVLLDCGLPGAAEVIFHRTVQGRPTGHAGSFLDWLHRKKPTYLNEESLRHRIHLSTPAETAHLILALEVARMDKHCELVLRASCIEQPAADAAMMLANLDRIDGGSPSKRSAEIIERIMLETLRRRSVGHQVDLVLALEEAILPERARQLEIIAATRVNPHAKAFKKALGQSRRAHQPAWYSPAIFSKGPDPALSPRHRAPR